MVRADALSLRRRTTCRVPCARFRARVPPIRAEASRARVLVRCCPSRTPSALPRGCRDRPGRCVYPLCHHGARRPRRRASGARPVDRERKEVSGSGACYRAPGGRAPGWCWRGRIRGARGGDDAPAPAEADRALPGDLGDPLLNTFILGWDADRMPARVSRPVDGAVLLPAAGHAGALGAPARDRDLHVAGRLGDRQPGPGVQPRLPCVLRPGGRGHVPARAVAVGAPRRRVARRPGLRLRAAPRDAPSAPAGAHVGMDARSACGGCTATSRPGRGGRWRCSPRRSRCWACRTATSCTSSRSRSRPSSSPAPCACAASPGVAGRGRRGPA